MNKKKFEVGQKVVYEDCLCKIIEVDNLLRKIKVLYPKGSTKWIPFRKIGVKK